MKGLTSTDWQLQNNDGDVNCSVGNIDDNTVITMYGAIWILGISGGTLMKYMTI